MKRLFILMVTAVMMFAFAGCRSVRVDPDSSFGTANNTKTDADLRYEQGYYADMYHKFQRLDLFAEKEFDYTVRVKENAGYSPIATTNDLFVDYNSYLNLVSDPDNLPDYYFNYLSPRSYTYTFLDAQQCTDVFDAYYNMLVDASYVESDVVGKDFNDQPIELYMRSYDNSEPLDIMILYNEVNSNSITVAFAPEYNPDRYQIDTMLDNVDVNGLSTLGYIGLVCGLVLLAAAVVFAVMVLLKKLVIKRK